MKVIKTIWGNSINHSVSGLILAENNQGKRHWYLGSSNCYSTEEAAINYIIDWGSKFTEEEFKEVLGLK